MRSLKMLAMIICISFAASQSANSGEIQDTRQLVKIPKDIEQKMFKNMRDHIAALDEIVKAIDAGEFEKAEDIAESRLGWSSLVRIGDQEVADHWAKPMQLMADDMYRSASNFVISVQNASVEKDKDSYKIIIKALGTMTSACRNCHEAYRVR